jgi:phenylalanyl-tRNA synthetase alpha chain
LVDDYLVLTVIERKMLELTDEGALYASKGTPEYQYASALELDVPTPKSEVEKRVGGEIAKIGFAKAMQRKWISLEGDKKDIVRRIAQELEDQEKDQLSKYKENPDYEAHDKKVAEQLKKRKLINVVTQKSYKVTKGPNFAPMRAKLETDLTADMIRSGAWKDAKFKKFNLNALGQAPEGGHLHPLLKVRAMFREILLEMGFNEMPTDKFVESSFWNFDTLFQPQSHPARDMHDTFFLKKPQMAKEFPAEYGEKVKEVHEVGGYDSLGYQYKWDVNEARKNLLRTHTTAVSSQMLYKLAEESKREGGFRPMKYFSIDRVFRNETLDATHLAEFHQIEGFIADRNIGLSHLLGIM